MNAQLAGVALNLYIGQRVRHCHDFKGRRVVGVIRALSLSEDVLHAEIGLDEALVIDPVGSMERPIHLYRQNVPAHELAPFDERDEQIAQLLATLTNLCNKGNKATWPDWSAALEVIAKTTGNAE